MVKLVSQEQMEEKINKMKCEICNRVVNIKKEDVYELDDVSACVDCYSAQVDKVYEEVKDRLLMEKLEDEKD